MRALPAVLVIAGSDSSGGAGIARDLTVLADHGIEGLCAITAVTAQTDSRLIATHHVPPELVRAQIGSALESRRIAAIKIGMLGTGATVCAVAESLPRGGAPPIVLDPVLRSSSGGELLDGDGRRELRERLLPLVTLLTPNIPEAETLCGASGAEDPGVRLALARQLLAAGPRAVLIKGGHARGERSEDLLLGAGEEPRWLTGPRIASTRRGTGCALSTAIAAALALGQPLQEACASARDYVRAMLSESPN